MADKLSVELEATGEAKATAAVNRYRSSLKAADREINNLGAGTSFAGKFDAQLAKAEARHRQFQQRIKQQSDAGGFGTGLLEGGGAALSVGAIAAAGVTALNAANQASDANRVLRATAVEVGISYDELASKADKFGERTALANGEGQRTFAQLVNFANAAGRTDKIDEFQKRFADLAAAKGINASQLGDISRQLNALTDEATDKLLNANPSAFYDKFAASIGKTAETLNDAEKRAAIFDEVLRKGAIFDGEADRRLNSASGATDQLKTKVSNLVAEIGKGVQPLAQFTLAVLNLFGGPRPDPEKAISAEIAASAERVRAGVELLRKTDADIKAAQANPLGSRQNLALSRVNLAATFNDPAARQKSIAEQTAIVEGEVKQLKEKLESSIKIGGPLAELANREFRAKINLFDLDTRDKFINDFSKVYADGFRKILSDANATLPQIRAKLAELSKSPNLTGQDRDRLVADFSAAIKKSVDEGKKRIDELRKANADLFGDLFAATGENNPFVKVFTDADVAIERVRLTTAALSKDLRAQAEQLQTTLNSNALFTARLESGLQSSDLRADAGRFRGNGKPFIDPAVFRNPGQFNQAVGRQFQNLQLSGNDSALNQASLLSTIARERLNAGKGENGTVQDRLDRQLAVIDGLRPGNDAQRAEADRKIIALTQGLDPATLSDAQNRAAAAARENEATRIEQTETKAREQRADQLKALQNLDANMKKLADIAETEGLQGTIRIINEAEDKAKVSLAKRPTQADTAKQMEF